MVDPNSKDPESRPQQQQQQQRRRSVLPVLSAGGSSAAGVRVKKAGKRDGEGAPAEAKEQHRERGAGCDDGIGGDDAGDEVCSVCLENFGGMSVVRLECGHRFHKKCLQEWFRHLAKEREAFCPYCKTCIDHIAPNPKLVAAAARSAYKPVLQSKPGTVR